MGSILTHCLHDQNGAMSGITVCMSAFLACHQCYSVGSRLGWGLNSQALICDIF